MATNVTAEFTTEGADGQSSLSTKTISVANQVVNTTPTATGGWNTATVTADLARTLVFAASDGVPPGRYEKCATARFRRNT